MRAVNGHRKKSPNRFQRQRTGLLAIVHIAKKALGFTDGEYRAVLKRYGASSAAALSIGELEDLVKYFETLGFVAKKGRSGGENQRKFRESHAEALRERVLQEAAKLENGEARMLGLLKSKAGVDRLEWCADVGKLKQVVRVLRVYQAKEIDPASPAAMP